jgi:drug/metabolite transporter (DMT)-like permease
MIGGVALVALAATSWGTWALFLRTTNVGPDVATPIVFAVMALVTLPFALRGPRVTWDRATIALVAANAFFDVTNVLAYFAALAKTTVAIAVLTHYLAPILIAVAAPRIDRTRTPGAGPAAAIALAGLVIILEPWRTPADGAVIGATLGVVSAVSYAGNVFVVRRLAMRIGAIRQMAYHTAVAAIAVAPLAWGHVLDITGTDLARLVAGGVTVGATAGVIFTIGLRRIGSARAAILAFIEPIVAVVIGATVFGEALRPIAALGGVMVLGAGVWVARSAVQAS